MTDTTSASQFAKKFLHVVNGSATIADFTRGLVSGAVNELLDSLCEEYDLDIDEVREKYEKTIVAKYASFDGKSTGPSFCQGTTTTGKPCGRSATHGKFCKTHMDKDNELKRTQGALEEYKERLSKMAKPPMPMGSQPTVFTQLTERNPNFDY